MTLVVIYVVTFNKFKNRAELSTYVKDTWFFPYTLRSLFAFRMLTDIQHETAYTVPGALIGWHL